MPDDRLAPPASGRGTRRPTSRDVAEAAGVSRATVGFVLNRTPSQTISEPTRRAVLDAARRLGYVPSAAARALRSGRSRLVLLLTPPWVRTETLSDFTRSVTTELAALGYVTVTHVTSTSSAADVLAAMTPAAVVSMAPLDPDDEAHLAVQRIPYVPAYLADYPGNPRTLTIAQQDIGGTQAGHLLSRGYERLVFVEPAESGYAGRADGRWAGVSDVAGAAVERFVADDRLAALAREWRESDERVGVCAFDDGTALPVLAALRDAGVDVPGQVGVIGVDDSSAARYACPPLTSVRLDLATEAHGLARRIVAVVAGDEPPATARTGTPTLVVERGSS